MKILIIDSANLTLHYTLLYCKHLEKNNCDVTLICSEHVNKNHNHLELFSTIPIQFFSKHRNITKFLKAINHLLGFVRTAFFIRKNNFDLIHFQISPLPLIDLFFINFFKKKTKLVATIHNTDPFHGEKNFFKSFGFNKLLQKYDFLLTHTRYSKKILVNKFKVSELKIKVINIPLYGDLKPIKETPNYEKKEYINVLFFGTLSKYKGLDLLIDSIGKLDLLDLKKIKFTIAGKPIMDIDPLIEEANKLDIQNNITWHLGWISDDVIHQLFLKADLIILPYKNIDGSAVLVQSMEYNLPVIASDIGGFSELIINNKTGFLVDIDDPDSIKNIFTYIIKNPDILNNMSKEVRSEAIKLPSWDDMAKSVISLNTPQN